MLDSASRRNLVCEFGNCSQVDNRVSTHLELHFLPPTEVIEVVGRLHNQCYGFRKELWDLTMELRSFRRRVGDVFESIAATQPALAPALALVHDPALHQTALAEENDSPMG